MCADATDPRERFRHPIIYVRGFAATQGEIEDTVADPYMGFNIGSTKSRKAWDGEIQRFYFESPLIRLMSDHGYEDVYVGGDDLVAATQSNQKVPYKCIIIHRYYDDVSAPFGSGEGGSPIEHFAKKLAELILRLKRKITENPDANIPDGRFRCYLVAHSMGGLVCRAFLQSPGLTLDDPTLSVAEARNAVDKMFTYATPHNGIDMRIVRNVPGWVTFGDVDNFNRSKMAGYLGLGGSNDVSDLAGKFHPERVFNLVGTNARDYAVAAGLSSWAVGDASDGLVRMENATTHGPDNAGVDRQSPRAFVHRSHSGHFGIVNSEEGYQNLTRFLFGTIRADGILAIERVNLPEEVDAALSEKKEIRASYQFETTVSVRGCQWQITRREARENSAIFRTYDELFPKEKNRQPDLSRCPHLFSIFLDPQQSVKGDLSMSFALQLKVLVPDYTIDGSLFRTRHYEGGAIYDRMIVVTAIQDPNARGGFRIRYGFQDEGPGKADRPVDDSFEVPAVGNLPAGLGFDINVVQDTRPGIVAKLRIEARIWQ
jgi:hypothetical protein